MKNKMIAIILAATLTTGVGVTAFALENPTQNTCVQTKNICSINKDKLCQILGLSNSDQSGNQFIQELLNKLGFNKNICSNSADQNGCNTGNQSGCNIQNNNQNTETTTGVDKSNESQATQKPDTTVQKPNTSTQNTSNTTQNTSTVTQKPETPAQKPSTPAQNQEVNDKFMAQVETMIFNKVNEERAKAGVPALTNSSVMQKYARIKSQDMGDRQYFNHADPQGNLMSTKMQNDGVKFSSWGENIAYIGGVSDATALANQFMTNWMNSPGHKQNILSTNYSGIGVGVYKVGNTVYATQEFYR